ncbi:Eukaryotic-type carbonic anhydrase [Tyrophagus putrescentiae]|nr:Eukaryotic-type carbonic anhydrase [Tyrophagus putrescentiae]
MSIIKLIRALVQAHIAVLNNQILPIQVNKHETTTTTKRQFSSLTTEGEKNRNNHPNYFHFRVPLLIVLFVSIYGTFELPLQAVNFDFSSISPPSLWRHFDVAILCTVIVTTGCLLCMSFAAFQPTTKQLSNENYRIRLHRDQKHIKESQLIIGENFYLSPRVSTAILRLHRRVGPFFWRIVLLPFFAVALSIYYFNVYFNNAYSLSGPFSVVYWALLFPAWCFYLCYGALGFMLSIVVGTIHLASLSGANTNLLHICGHIRETSRQKAPLLSILLPYFMLVQPFMLTVFLQPNRAAKKTAEMKSAQFSNREEQNYLEVIFCLAAVLECNAVLYLLVSQCSLVDGMNWQIERALQKFNFSFSKEVVGSKRGGGEEEKARKLSTSTVKMLLKAELLQASHSLRSYTFTAFGCARIVARAYFSIVLYVSSFYMFIFKADSRRRGGGSGEQGETASPEWEYRQQNRWARDFPECGGRRQSPVNIDPKRVVKLIDGKLGSGLHLRGYGRFRRSYNVTNTGRSIMFTYAGRREAERPSISGLAVGGSGRGEREQFVLQQFHFHWGQVEGVGSEHTLGGDRYDMELHLVHFNRRRYGTFERAMASHAQGVVVLAVLFEVRREPRRRLNPLIDAISLMADYPMGFTTRLDMPIRLEDFLPRERDEEEVEAHFSLFRYPGSLTTPPCTEGVRWLVVGDPVAIGRRQIGAFRAVKDFLHRTAEGNNFRRLQPLSGRQFDFLKSCFMVVRVAVASLVLHRILTFTFNSPEEYFSSVDILIGHLFKLGVLNRYLGLVCAPFTLLVLFDYWFYFGGDGNNSTYRLLYDLVVLNKRNFFQLNPQLGGWTGLAKMKFQEWWFTKKDAQKIQQQKIKLTVTTTPLNTLSTLPTSIRLQAALFSLTADLLTMLLFAYFSLITAIFQPHSFLQTEYLGSSLPLRLLIFFEVFFVTTVSLYNSLLSLLLGHFLSLVVFVLKRLQTAATAQLKLRIELTKRRKRRQGAKNHSLATFLQSAYLPLHNRVVIHFTRANEQLFSRALFYFISAVLVVNIYVVTQLMFEEEKLSADMKLHLVVGCLYQLSVFVFALRPMMAAQRVMVAAGLQHFRSQVYLASGSGSGSLSLRLKLSAITTIDNRKQFVFAFTLGPLGPVTAKFIMELLISYIAISPEHYFATVDLLIGHMLKIGLLNRHMGLPCVPFILLALFDHWFYFGGSSSGGGGGGDNTTYRLLYDLTVLNKRNFFQLNPQQLGGWKRLVKLKLQEWFINKKTLTKLRVTSFPLACLSNLPSAIRLRAALFSFTADLLIALLFAYFGLGIALFLPYSFLQTSYLGSPMLRLYVLAEMSILGAVTLYKVLITLLLGHLFALLEMVLRRQQATATAQLKRRIALVERGRGENSGGNTRRLKNLATFLGSAYLPLHRKVVMHCQRANDQLFSRSLFYFISATLVMNIDLLTRLVFETWPPLQSPSGPMVATERVMVEAGLQHFRSQVYLGSGSGNSGGNWALSFKLAATTTTDSRKPYAFAFTLGPLGPVTAKFIMELFSSYSAYLLFSFSIVINEKKILK